jgi:hypothetical protein
LAMRQLGHVAIRKLGNKFWYSFFNLLKLRFRCEG